MIIKPISGVGLAVLLAGAGFCGGCSQTPAKEPGANPEATTAEAQRAAAQREEQLAAEHEQEEENVGPSKPNLEEDQKANQQWQAEHHRRLADEHNEAADIVEGNK